MNRTVLVIIVFVVWVMLLGCTDLNKPITTANSSPSPTPQPTCQWATNGDMLTCLGVYPSEENEQLKFAYTSGNIFEAEVNSRIGSGQFEIVDPRVNIRKFYEDDRQKIEYRWSVRLVKPLRAEDADWLFRRVGTMYQAHNFQTARKLVNAELSSSNKVDLLISGLKKKGYPLNDTTVIESTTGTDSRQDACFIKEYFITFGKPASSP